MMTNTNLTHRALRAGVVSIGAAVAALCAPVAQAADAAFTAPATGSLNQGHDPGSFVNLANVFTANANFFVDSLGVWRDPGFLAVESVGLYDMTNGQLLASTTVSLTDTLAGGFLYRAITPVALQAGHQYQVTAYTNGNSWTYGPVPTTDARITYTGHLYNYTNQLAFSTQSAGAGGQAYYGPNFTITDTVTAVPEPESYAMLLAGLGVLGAVTRRRQAKGALPS